MMYCYAMSVTYVYSLLILILFYRQKRIKNEQTKIFSKMIISNNLGLLFDMTILIYLIYTKENYNMLIAMILAKAYLVYTIIFCNQVTLYIFATCYNKEKNEYYNRIKAYSNFFCLLCIPISIALPCHIQNIYSYGTGPIFTVGYTLINLLFWIVCLSKNFKKFNKKIIVPLFFIMIICCIVGLIQTIFPYIVIVTIMEFEVLFIVYLTMENTDYKMIADLKKAESAVQDAYKEKNEFLKNMSHEIRTPLNGIIGLSEDIKLYKTSNPEGLNKDTEEIIYNSNLLLETVSSIIDINKLSSQQLNKVESNYSISDVVDQINKSISDKIKDDVKLNIKISDSVPTLYGDNNHIRQIITKILENSISSTKNGNIDLKIDLIKKNDQDVLRIIIEDTGHGIHDEVIPYIYNYNDEKIKNNKHYHAKIILNFTVVKKIVDMLHGTISVSSTYKQGTTVVIEIPQKIDKGGE